MKSKLCLAVATALLMAGCATSPVEPRHDRVTLPPVVDVKIIAFNDFHGNLKTPNLRVPVPDPTQSTGFRLEAAGGAEQFSALVQKLKAKNPNHVVVSAGDLVGATPLLSAFFKDEPTIEAMNLVGVDIHAVGNHEFDYGPAHLKRLRSGGCAPDKNGKPDCGTREPYAGARFPFLAANVLETATGQTLFPAYVIKDFQGARIAFIGLTLRGTLEIVRPGGTAGLVFHDEVDTVNKLVPEIKAKGVEAIAVVIHEGGMQGMGGGINDCKDFSGKIKDITERFDPAVDIVLSAHSHQFYVCELAGKLLTSAGSYGRLVTEMDVRIDRASGKVIGRKAVNLVVDPKGPKDAAVGVLVDRYAKLAEAMENKPVANVTREINMVATGAGESTMGNLIADAQLFASAAPDKGGAVIAFNNPGSLRSTIVPGADGSVKYGDLFKTQPFQNDLIAMNLTGRQLKALLEQQFPANPVERPRIMGVSQGFSYAWDAAKPRGEKILFESMKLNGAPIKAELQYRVVANSFIAGGSEGMTVFREGTERQTGVLDLEALVAYLSAHSPYTPPMLGRIGRLN